MRAVPEPSPHADVVSPFDLPVSGLRQLAFVPKQRTPHKVSDLDLFEMRGKVYAVQVQQEVAGFVLSDVTDVSKPFVAGVWLLDPVGQAEHIKAFRQDNRWYVVLPLESQPSATNRSPCGLAIVEITNPLQPTIHSLHNGTTVGADAAWCNVHSVEIVTDAAGNATHLLAAATDTFDVRVLDVHDLGSVREVNVYHHHAHPHSTFQSFAHQLTISNDRVYVAQWAGGVTMVDKADLLAGLPVQAEVVMVTDVITTPTFVAHDAYPTPDGQFLFVNDAFKSSNGVRLVDMRNPAQPNVVATINVDGLYAFHHTLLVQDDLLFVPWFQGGVRVFRYDLTDPNAPIIEPVAVQEVRKYPMEAYDGVFRLRLRSCTVDGKTTTCIFASDMTLGLLILALDIP